MDTEDAYDCWLILPNCGQSSEASQTEVSPNRLKSQASRAAAFVVH